MATRTVFDVDQQTLDVMQALQGKLGARNNAEVFRKALLLAQFATEYADAENGLTIVPAGGGANKRVMLSQ